VAAIELRRVHFTLFACCSLEVLALYGWDGALET
jgi:hypothetical protein